MTYKTARVWYYFVFAAMTFLTAANNFASADPRASELLNRLTNSSLSFTENKGQFPDHILYQAFVPNATIWVTKTGMQYQFIRSAGEITDPIFTDADAPENSKPKIPVFKQLIVSTKLRNANVQPYTTAQGMLEGKSNYFLGNDPNKWVSGVSNYSSVVLYDVYPGTDLYYYGAGSKIEYDFSLAPGADPSLIQIEYEGTKSLTLAENGDLLIETDWSTITQHKPMVYQEHNGVRIPLDAHYAIVEPNVIGFNLPSNYNPALALVIDPQISYGTYIGHSDDDIAWDVAVDNCQNAYLVGYTNSASFPTSGGAYQTTIGGDVDVFVAKLNTRDSGAGTLVYSTFVGGDLDDWGYGIAINSSGEAYITGRTKSSDFPITGGVYDNNFGAYSYDEAFITKLSSAGTSLGFSTFIGGGGLDYGYGIALDDNDNSYMLGITYLRDSLDPYPYVKGYEFSTANGNQLWEVVLTKLNSSGTNVLYSTMLGGTGADNPGFGVDVDEDELAYIAGYTASSNFDVVSAYDNSYNSTGDAFVAVFDTKDSFNASLIYSTFFGGSAQEAAQNLALDANGKIHFTGYTYSSSGFPLYDTISSAYQGTHGGGSDGFYATLDHTAGTSGLLWSTYIGGIANEELYDIAIDFGNFAVVVGRSDSIGWPNTNAIDGTYNGGGRDIVAAHFHHGHAVTFASYFGGSAYDAGYGVAIGGNQAIYLAGKSLSTGLFGSVLTYDASHNTDSDAVVIKIAPSGGTCEPGDVNDDGVVDRNDQIYLTAYLFSGGPNPVGTSGRINNCDAAVTVADITALVQYLANCTTIGCTACP